MTQFSFGWILSLNWLCQKWGQVHLHLYDAASEKLYTIKTNQADSEVLLVENGTVYYRINEKLYSATIDASTTTIGAPTLLATDELVRDAHRAFIKH